MASREHPSLKTHRPGKQPELQRPCGHKLVVERQPPPWEITQAFLSILQSSAHASLSLELKVTEHTSHPGRLLLANDVTITHVSVPAAAPQRGEWERCALPLARRQILLGHIILLNSGFMMSSKPMSVVQLLFMFLSCSITFCITMPLQDAGTILCILLVVDLQPHEWYSGGNL